MRLVFLHGRCALVRGFIHVSVDSSESESDLSDGGIANSSTWYVSYNWSSTSGERLEWFDGDLLDLEPWDRERDLRRDLERDRDRERERRRGERDR